MKRALVLGDAASVFEEIEAALDLAEVDAVAACNNMIVNWNGHLDYAVTLHPEACRDWVGIVEALRLREAAGLNRPETWAHAPSAGIDRWTKHWRGSSGLHAVTALLEIGFDRIVLAGVPLSESDGHFYDRRPWHAAPSFRSGWLAHVSEIRTRVRSMSGWTAELLGRPSVEWLRSE